MVSVLFASGLDKFLDTISSFANLRVKTIMIMSGPLSQGLV